MPIELGDGATVRVTPPGVPRVLTDPPGRPTVRVLPSPGPPGPDGDQGDPGPPADLAEVQQRIDDALITHVIDPEPHPAYDDMPSLTLLFENRLV
jgi:hypothetical protein